jgi:hypothetical protein
MHGQVVVVQAPVAVGQHGTYLSVEGAQQAPVGLALQPGVDVAVQQCRLVLAHALEIGIRNVQLVGELPARERRHAIGCRSACLLDYEGRSAAFAGAVAHQWRGHYQIFLGVELALQLLGQIQQGTSASHDNLLRRERSGDGRAPAGMRIPAWADEGPA